MSYERNYRIHPDDPNSARATMTQTYEMARGDWQVRINAGAEMTSTATTFELSAWLEAFEGDKWSAGASGGPAFRGGTCSRWQVPNTPIRSVSSA